MAKKKSIEEAEATKSFGEQMKNKSTQRDRNLAVKAEMIERGEREEPEFSGLKTQKEKNLALKEQLKNEKAKGEKTKK